MDRIKDKIRHIWLLIIGLIPMAQPVGRTAFELWAGVVCDTYGLPNTPGYRQALCQMLLQEKRYYVSRISFALKLRKAQVNETAYQIMTEIQQQKKEAEQAEATARNVTKDVPA